MSLVETFVEEIGGFFRTHESQVKGLDISRLSLAQAYEVQDGFAARVKRGAKVVGWKVGCTSAAIRPQFGLTEPISGKLLMPDVFSVGRSSCLFLCGLRRRTGTGTSCGHRDLRGRARR